MARVVSLQEAQTLQGQPRAWAYNALDCTGTREVADALLPRLSPAQARTYAFERACLAPAAAMMMRGVLIDPVARAKAITAAKRELKKIEREIAKMPGVVDTWDGLVKVTGWCTAEPGKRHKWPRGVEDTPDRLCERCGASRFTRSPFNANSSKQCAHLFYDLYKLKVERDKTGKPSTDEECLRRLGRKHKKVTHITDAILVVRSMKKQLGFLQARLSKSGRYPSSFNVGTAWTGRWSASKNPYGEGGNLQNIAERFRHIFVSDPGQDMCYADLEQAESRDVAYEAGDEEYIAAHLSGDVHTYVSRMIWPDLPWTGDLKADKKVAQVNPPWDLAPGHNWRFQAKRIQHGSNYGLTPQGIAMIAHIPMIEADRAAHSYHGAFPKIRAWQNHQIARVKEQLPLSNPLGRTITLFGRPWDKHTHKQGLAFSPQSLVADVIDTALWHVWKHMDPWEVELLAQIHDALLFQYESGKLSIVHKVVERMTIPIPVTDIYGVTRMMTIPVEAAVGKNWGHSGDDNPLGLKEI